MLYDKSYGASPRYSKSIIDSLIERYFDNYATFGKLLLDKGGWTLSFGVSDLTDLYLFSTNSNSYCVLAKMRRPNESETTLIMQEFKEEVTVKSI